MSSGLLFYWFSWILWILITFFMSKNKLRTLLACWLFLLILCSDLYILNSHFQISVSYLILVAGALILHTTISGMFLHVFSSFTIMIGFAGLLIWENHTPIKLFFPSFMIVSCILFIMVCLLTTGIWTRLACILLGMTGGELLYGIIMTGYSLTDIIGDKRFLDFIMMLTMVILCQDFLLKIKMKIAHRLRKSNVNPKPLFKKQAQ